MALIPVVSVSTGGWQIIFHQVVQVPLPKIRESCIAWAEWSVFCLFWMMMQDFAVESGPWQILEFQNLKFTISRLEFQTVVKTIFLLMSLGWLFLARCLMQLTELTYLHGLKRLFSLLASPSWMTHLRSSCWQRRCFWSCRWHCQHLNEIQCQGKHMKNVGNNTVNCMRFLKKWCVCRWKMLCIFHNDEEINLPHFSTSISASSCPEGFFMAYN